MPAWLEGNITYDTSPYSAYFYPGNFNTANVLLLYWLRIDNPIPNGLSSNEFYIGIFNRSVDEYGVSGVLGSNPTFHCDSGCPSIYYGGADNGGSVFDFYDNFWGNYSSTSNSDIIDSAFAAQNATWTVDNGLTFTQVNSKDPVPYVTPTAIVYMYAKSYAPLGLSQNISIDENIWPFYGRDDYILPYGPFEYLPNYGTIGFFGADYNLYGVNQLDMGGIVDSNPPGFYPPEQLYLYSNNGTGMIKTPVTYGESLPLTLTLYNNEIYVQANYSNVEQEGVQTNIQFSNGGDLFAISSSIENCNPETSDKCASSNKVQWVRIRTPPPDNIFPLVIEEGIYPKFNQTINTTSTSTSTTTTSTTTSTMSSITLVTSSIPTTLSTTTIGQTTEPTSSTTTSSSTTSLTSSTATTTATSSTSSSTTASTVQTSTIPPAGTADSNSTGQETPEEAGALNIVQSGGGYVSAIPDNPNPLFQNPSSSINSTKQNITEGNLTMSGNSTIPGSNSVNTSSDSIKNGTLRNNAQTFVQSSNDPETNSPQASPEEQTQGPAEGGNDNTLLEIAVGVALASFAIAAIYTISRKRLREDDKRKGYDN